MDQITHEVRAENWRKIIQACHERPAGMSAKQWLSEHNVVEKTYYYWQRKFRAEAYTQMKQSIPMEQKPAEITFAELTPPALQTVGTNEHIMPEAVIHIGAASIEINSSTSDQLIARILKAANYAG